MKCPKCGADCVEGASFCSECGEPIAFAQAAKLEAGGSNAKSKVSARKKVLVGVLAVVMLVVIGFATGVIKVGPITSHPVKDYGNGYEITYKGLEIDKAANMVDITGKVKNTTGNNANITMLWRLMDADGNEVGTAVAEADSVDPGKTADFDGLCIPSDGSLWDDAGKVKSTVSTWQLLTCKVE